MPAEKRHFWPEDDAADLGPSSYEAGDSAQVIQLMPPSFEGIISDFEEDLGMGTWMVSVLTGDVYWSEGTYKIHDVAPNTPIGLESAFSYFAREDEQHIRDVVDAARQREQDFVFEATLIGETGRRKRVRSYGRCIDRNGAPFLMGVIALIGDDAPKPVLTKL
ncbi:hypothetical protein [Sphingomicrobium marinum]|uniref:hypothetical protein n=1 Tax=Sphingomicrobium marinum TaxID=1227950 RepID=UPI00223F6A15|nr:hypothetical protein [Sphingomicrobium marinum]